MSKHPLIYELLIISVVQGEDYILHLADVCAASLLNHVQFPVLMSS